MKQIFVPKEGFVTTVDGTERMFHERRTTVEEGHPVLIGREHLFEPQRVDFPAPKVAAKK